VDSKKVKTTLAVGKAIVDTDERFGVRQRSC